MQLAVAHGRADILSLLLRQQRARATSRQLVERLRLTGHDAFLRPLGGGAYEIAYGGTEYAPLIAQMLRLPPPWNVLDTSDIGRSAGKEPTETAKRQATLSSREPPLAITWPPPLLLTWPPPLLTRHGLLVNSNSPPTWQAKLSAAMNSAAPLALERELWDLTLASMSESERAKARSRKDPAAQLRQVSEVRSVSQPRRLEPADDAPASVACANVEKLHRMQQAAAKSIEEAETRCHTSNGPHPDTSTISDRPPPPTPTPPSPCSLSGLFARAFPSRPLPPSGTTRRSASWREAPARPRSKS